MCLVVGALLGVVLGFSFVVVPVVWAQGKGYGGKEEREWDCDRDCAGLRVVFLRCRFSGC